MKSKVSSLSFVLHPSSFILRYVFALPIVVCLVVLYWSSSWEMYKAWTIIDSYYSHGFLIPIISLFFVWRQREELLRAEYQPGGLGYPLVIGSILLLWASGFLGFRVVGQLSIVSMLTGVSLLLLGKRRTALLWFPLLFLIFMIPIPASMTQSVALKLKLLATECAVVLANWCTLPMVRDGSFIHFSGDKLQVGEVCGGLRSLIALLAFGSLMAYLSKTKPWARILLLLLSGPVAIIANVLRIFALCLVGYFYGSEVAAGKFHDVSGVMIFVVAFIMFFSIETQLRRWAPASEGRMNDELGMRNPEGKPPSYAADRDAGGPRSVSSFILHPSSLTLLLLVVATAGHLRILSAQKEDVATRDAAGATLAIPERIGDFRALGLQGSVDERTQQVLETSSILIQNYVSPRGIPVQLTIVYAGTTRRSLHFPEVCLVGDGWDIQEQSAFPVGILFTAKRLVLVKGGTSEAVLYWFKTGDNFTGNFFLNALDWAWEQVARGAPTSAMIKLTARIGPGGREAAFAVLEEFATKLTPILLDRVK